MQPFTLVHQLHAVGDVLSLTRLASACVALASNEAAPSLAHQQLLDGLESLAHAPKIPMRIAAINLMGTIAQAPTTLTPLRKAFFLALTPFAIQDPALHPETTRLLKTVYRRDDCPEEIRQEVLEETRPLRRREAGAQTEEIARAWGRFQHEESVLEMELERLLRGVFKRPNIFDSWEKKSQDATYPEVLKKRIAEAVVNFLSNQKYKDDFPEALSVLASLQDANQLTANQLQIYGEALLAASQVTEALFKLLSRDDLPMALQRDLRILCGTPRKGLGFPDSERMKFYVSPFTIACWLLPGECPPSEFLHGEEAIVAVEVGLGPVLLDKQKVPPDRRLSLIQRVAAGDIRGLGSLIRPIILTPQLEESLPYVVRYLQSPCALKLKEFFSPGEIAGLVSRFSERRTALIKEGKGDLINCYEMMIASITS